MKLHAQRVALAVAALGSLMTGPAGAAEITLSSFRPEFVGIDAAKATLFDSVAYVQRIDLDAPGIGFTTTPKSGPLATTGQTTSQFLQSSGTQVAINANFFAPCCASAAEPKSLVGLAVSNGTVVSPLATGAADAAASLFLSQSNQASIQASDAAGVVDAASAFNAVSGNLIVTNGMNSSAVTPTGSPHDPFGLDPRTGVGVSKNGQFLYLIAIDGRQPGYSAGVTTPEEAQLMLALGIYQGLNLDGGGSTALVESSTLGPEDIDRPSTGTERYDGNNLGVYASALSTVPLPGAAPMFGAALALLGLFGARLGRKHMSVSR